MYTYIYIYRYRERDEPSTPDSHKNIEVREFDPNMVFVTFSPSFQFTIFSTVQCECSGFHWAKPRTSMLVKS